MILPAVKQEELQLFSVLFWKKKKKLLFIIEENLKKTKTVVM